MTVADVASDISQIVRSLASLGWVLVAGCALYLFREDIQILIGRIRRVDTPVGSAELDPEVEELKVVATDSSDAILRQTPVHSSSPNFQEDETGLPTDPRLAVVLIVTKIEERVKDIASISGYDGTGRTSWPVLLDWLVGHGAVPAGVASSHELISSVRGRIVHGGIEDIDNREVRASLDAGLRLLRALDAIPREGYEVAVDLLLVFHDHEATRPIDDCRGVLLRSFDAQGQEAELHIYPTQRSYSQGVRVGWQWSFERTWGEAYWKDPFDDMIIKEAWSESAEFVGEALIRQP